MRVILVAVFVAAIGGAGVLIGLASAGQYNATSRGVLIEGYDPVAYIEQGYPRKGDPDYEVLHDGVTVFFADEENMALFVDDPDRFMPAYGGFCSYGVRMGQKLDINPRAFTIKNGRLFLQHDFGTQSVWRMDEAENIEIADSVWPRIAEGPVDGKVIEVQ
ncbi:MAG: YHS domain-containing (seleno)protein [Pseudomonadota bacterium]